MSSSNQLVPLRKSRGRQKVNMVKMENHSNLQVTFSKRRAGLFKKASELCTLCGAEAAIVVFSPADKVYCFGHPNVKNVVDRLAAGVAPMETDPRSQLIIEAHRNSTNRQLNLELTQVESFLRAEKRRAEELESIRKSGQMQQWLPKSFDDFNFAQLCVLKEAILGFKKNFDVKVQNDMRSLANPLPFPHPAEKTENPSGFSHGVGADISRVPTFNVPKMSLGSGGFFPYSNGPIGLSNSGLVPLNSSLGQASDFDPITNTGNISAHYLRACGSSGATFFAGETNSSSSSKLPTDPKDIGNRGFGLF